MTVEELLIEEGIQFKQSPADYVIRCLNPEHDDTNPVSYTHLTLPTTPYV